MQYNLSQEHERKAFELRCKTLQAQGAKVSLLQIKAKRSLSQNAIFHLWVAVIADALGEVNREQVKSDIKSFLLGRRITYNLFTGEEESAEYRTRSLSQEQMSDFLTRLKAWSEADLGIILPSPEDEAFAFMQERYGYE